MITNTTVENNFMNHNSNTHSTTYHSSFNNKYHLSYDNINKKSVYNIDFFLPNNVNNNLSNSYKENNFYNQNKPKNYYLFNNDLCKDNNQTQISTINKLYNTNIKNYCLVN